MRDILVRQLAEQGQARRLVGRAEVVRELLVGHHRGRPEVRQGQAIFQRLDAEAGPQRRPRARAA
jgi:hypothetical protein